MRLPLIQLPAVQNVVAGNTALLNLPVGGRAYDMVQLHLTNITAAQLTNIRVKVDGKEIMFFPSATVLQDINDFYGRPADANIYQIWMARPEMNDRALQRVTSLRTGDVQSVTVEADISGAAVNPAITAYAIISDPGNLGLISKVKRYPFTAAAGQNELTNIVGGPSILAAHLYKADVTSLYIEDGGQIVVNATKTALETSQKSYGRVPQTAVMTSIDFCLEGNHGDALPTSGRNRQNVQMNRPLRYLPTITAGGALDVMVEYLDFWAGI